MKNFILTAFVSLFLFSYALANDKDGKGSLERLDQARKEYQSDKDALDQIDRKKEKILTKNKHHKIPNSGPEWSEALKVWLQQMRQSRIGQLSTPLLIVYGDGTSGVLLLDFFS